MSRALGISLIAFYQQRLSPRKGFCCAHRVVHGGSSCSQFAARALARRGWLLFFPLMRRRFDRCALAAMRIQGLQDDERNAKEQRKSGDCADPTTPCDCAPTPALPGCDQPDLSCDTPGCDGVDCSGCDLSF